MTYNVFGGTLNPTLLLTLTAVVLYLLIVYFLAISFRIAMLFKFADE